MMRGVFLALGLAVSGAAQAGTPMLQEDCRAGWGALNNAMADPGRFLEMDPVVNEQGWCQLDRSFATLRADDFEKVVWRATGVATAVENQGFPESFEAVFAGIDLIEAFEMPLPERYAGTMGALDLIQDETITPASRSAIKDFLDAGASAKGRLLLELESENGIGLLQFVGAMMSYDESGGGDVAMAAAVEQVLTGAELSAAWTPRD